MSVRPHEYGESGVCVHCHTCNDSRCCLPRSCGWRAKREHRSDITFTTFGAAEAEVRYPQWMERDPATGEVPE